MRHQTYLDPAHRRRVVVVQPRVPTYRVAMFRHLGRLLDASALDLVLVTPPITAEESLRSDEAAAELPNVVSVPAKTWSVAGRQATFRRTSALVSTAHAAVLEYSGSNMDSYINLAMAASRGQPTMALWGHGYAATTERGALEERILGLSLRLCDHFFAYTPGGVSYAVERGVPDARVTVLRNSIDTRGLAAAALMSASDADAEAHAGTTALFVGALDESKRLDFLLSASDLVRQRVPEFSLVIGGDGAMRPWLIREIAHRPWISYVGQLDPASEAMWAGRSAVIAMPGRVGLVAVDSFVLGKPIVTTDWRFHSVEFEYLRHDVNAIVTGDSVDAYADGLATLLNDRARLKRLSSNAADEAQHYGAEAMAQRFADGVLSMISAGKRIRRARQPIERRR